MQDLCGDVDFARFSTVLHFDDQIEFEYLLKDGIAGKFRAILIIFHLGSSATCSTTKAFECKITSYQAAWGLCGRGFESIYIYNAFTVSEFLVGTWNTLLPG